MDIPKYKPDTRPPNIFKNQISGLGGDLTGVSIPPAPTLLPLRWRGYVIFFKEAIFNYASFI